MNKGILIFAHNSREVDYILTAVVSGALAKKYLKVSISLVTDTSTLDWAKTSNIYSRVEEIFDNIIIVDKPISDNTRILNDGSMWSRIIPFVNANRADAYLLTPYDRTLLIDSDFLIFSDNLSNYWDVDASLLISPAMNDIRGDRIGVLDKWVSDEGIPLLWATTVMFTKNNESKLFFELVNYIRQNYDTFSLIYRFNPKIFRNDIAFSIAKHMLDGFETKSAGLPPILTSLDTDIVYSINSDTVKILVENSTNQGSKIISSIVGRDLHIMNKQAIVRAASTLLEIL
jgi:hypothetical protein